MHRTSNTIALIFGSCVLLQSASVRATFWPLAESEVERALQKANVHERRAAARRIGELSPSVARTALEHAIGDRDREVRLISLRTARAFDIADLSPLALESLKSPDVVERIEAVRLIALAPGVSEVAALESMTSDADAIVRREVAEALGRVPQAHASTSTAKLLSMLDDSEASVRLEVAASLGRLGQPSAVLSLAARLNDPEPDVRIQVALALGAIGLDTAIPALQVALLDAQDSVVAAVVTSLGALDSEEAIAGLVAIAEKAPLRTQGQVALEALVRLSKFPSARQHILDLLESPEHNVVLQQVFLKLLPESIPILSECVKTFSSEIALKCARALTLQNGDTALILEAQEQGRLSGSEVLEVLVGVSDRTAIVLALERLSLGASAEFRSALRYLGSQSELPLETEAPLTEALTVKGRNASEVVSIARILGSIRNASPSSNLVSLLTATDEAVKQSASFALVRRGASGEDLQRLLLAERSIAAGALEGLGLGMTEQQAEVLIRLVEDGHSGRRGAFLSVFFAMPESLPGRALERLWKIYDGARGAERDALLYPLVRAGRPQLWSRLIDGARRADKLKVAQLTWYQPRAVAVARRLIGDGDPEVAAAAALSLGKNGTAKDAQALGKLALSTHPHLLRAAAVQGLTFLAERGEKPAVPKALFAGESCESAHRVYLAQVTRLGAALGHACDGQSLEDVLTRDPDPRRRRLAAALLRRKAPESPALRTCRFYEPRPEIANECWPPPNAPPHPPSVTLPYRVHEIHKNRRPLKLTPFAVRAPGSVLQQPEAADFGLRLVTDRAGHVVLPVAAYEAVDPNWFF